jgi:alpha-tubulin suppressor-like RCC1 family protein
MGESLLEVDLGSDSVKQISLGYQLTCALFKNDRVKCWGNNDMGQTGILPEDHAIGDDLIFLPGMVMPKMAPQLIKDIPYVDPL